MPYKVATLADLINSEQGLFIMIEHEKVVAYVMVYDTSKPVT